MLAREFEQVGAAAVIIHGRTREQGFSGKVNRDGIRAVVEAVDNMPVIGNGDIRTIADAEQMFLTTGCAGISIGAVRCSIPGFSRNCRIGMKPAIPVRQPATSTVWNSCRAITICWSASAANTLPA